jgi:predicted TIM-barrel fold metal-dependent hydrolase
MDRRAFLKTGSVAVGLTVASLVPPAAASAPGRSGLVEVMVARTRLARGKPVAANRRRLIGLSPRLAGTQARLVLANAWSGESRSVDAMRRENDQTAELCATQVSGVFALAGLGSHPLALAAELERCVTRLGLRGGTLQLDPADIRDGVRAYYPVFEAAQALGVPLHVAPKGPADWGWSSALTEALVASGCFARFPATAIVVDQVDDELAGTLARVDDRFADRFANLGHRRGGLPSQQIRHGMFFTTSGLNYHPALAAVVAFMGSDRVLYASDRAFAYDQAAVAQAMALPHDDVARIMGANAAALFNLA